jgi:hypothetical protein
MKDNTNDLDEVIGTVTRNNMKKTATEILAETEPVKKPSRKRRKVTRKEPGRLTPEELERKANAMEVRIRKNIGMSLFLYAAVAVALIMIGGGNTWTLAGVLMALVLAFPVFSHSKTMYQHWKAFMMYRTLSGWMGDERATIDPLEGRIRTRQEIEDAGHYQENTHLDTTWKPSIWGDMEGEYTDFFQKQEQISTQ